MITTATAAHASPGTHTVTIVVSWQYLSLINSTWTHAPPVTLSGHIPVETVQPPPQSSGPPNPGTSSSSSGTQDLSDELILMVNQYLLPAAGVFWIMSFVGLALVVRDKKKPPPSLFQRFCSNCGTEAEAWNRFCTRCGTELRALVSPDRTG